MPGLTAFIHVPLLISDRRILSLTEIDYGYINASVILCDQNGWIWRLSLIKKMMIGACETDWINVFSGNIEPQLCLSLAEIW